MASRAWVAKIPEGFCDRITCARIRRCADSSDRHPEILWRLSCPARHRPGHPRGRVLLPAGAVGVRQDDVAACDRGVRGCVRGHRRHLGPGHDQAVAQQAAHQYGVPVLCHFPSSERYAERRIRLAQTVGPDCRSQGQAGRGGTRHGRAWWLWRAGGQRTVRGAAATGRAGPCAGAAAQGSAAGRAAERAGQEDARTDAGGIDPPATAGRHHLHSCHPRPGGGAGHVRPHCRHVRGRDRATGRGRGSVSQARQPPRGRIHRHDELSARCGRRRRGRGRGAGQDRGGRPAVDRDDRRGAGSRVPA